MSKNLKVGSVVSWKWGQGEPTGKIKEIYSETIHKTIKGTKVTRHGTSEDPAYLIEENNGNIVLKLRSELIS